MDAPIFNKEDASDNALGQAVWRNFCEGRPYVKVIPQDRPGNFSVVDGVLHIRPGTFKPGFIFAHEIGHILEATNKELFTFNLGMGDVSKNDGPRLPDFAERAWRESRVVGYQFKIMRLLSFPVDRIERVAGIFGGICGKKAEWTKRMYSAFNDETTDLYDLWERKMALIQKARLAHMGLEKVAA